MHVYARILLMVGYTVFRSLTIVFLEQNNSNCEIAWVLHTWGYHAQQYVQGVQVQLCKVC